MRKSTTNAKHESADTEVAILPTQYADYAMNWVWYPLETILLFFSFQIILGSRLDTYVEAEAFIESKQDGRLPFFREKPQFTPMIEGKDLELTCFAVGEPQPIIQWFK